jgi:hypothetical protein
VEATSPYKRAVLALKRVVAAVLNLLRRIAGGIFQVIFRDQLGNISRQTERLGSASVESVTYLGGEVRSLDQRLAAIERELAELRAILERRAGSPAEDSEAVAARQPGD